MIQLQYIVVASPAWQYMHKCLSGNRLLEKKKKKPYFSASQKAFLWWLMSSNTTATRAAKIKRRSASLDSRYLKATFVMAACLSWNQTHQDSGSALWVEWRQRTKTSLPIFAVKKASKCERQKTACRKACDLFRVFIFTFSGAGSCEAEH